jgi:hypothetical protein
VLNALLLHRFGVHGDTEAAAEAANEQFDGALEKNQ